MESRKDFTKSIYALTPILKNSKIGKTTKHAAEHNAIKTMTDSANSVIVCVSSNGAADVPTAAHKNPSHGSVTGEIIHQGTAISDGLANGIRDTAMRTFGNGVRTAANEARRNSKQPSRTKAPELTTALA